MRASVRSSRLEAEATEQRTGSPPDHAGERKRPGDAGPSKGGAKGVDQPPKRLLNFTFTRPRITSTSEPNASPGVSGSKASSNS